MKNIIIIDDGLTMTEGLCGLEKNYNILHSGSVSDGHKLAAENDGRVSAVIMSAKAAAESQLKWDIPVLAAADSAENNGGSPEAGASDIFYLSESGETVSKRLNNIIRLHEAESLCGKVERDPLTGAYTKDFFMEHMLRRVKSEPDKSFDLVCLEIESYDLIYGRYGVEICDMFMSTMVKSLGEMLPPGTLMGTAEEGHILFMMPHIPFEFHENMMRGCMNMAANSPFPLIAINAGVYPCIGQGVSAEEIYSDCLLAIEGIRFKYDRFIAEYNDEIKQKKQRLASLGKNMHRALQEKHFKVYYQPKYSMQGDKIQGAEALVRWIDPEMGFMNPGEFIPLFEKNGFIFELDKYILEEVCCDIRKWLDKGEKAVPVSVNVSQTDFDQMSLDEMFEKIVDKYGIPHEYIHFEITESAEAPDAIKKGIAVSGFRKRGFEVELDDFGSGYSTLTVLKQMPVDVMKIDMSLVRSIFDPNGKAILEGAVFTAEKLGIKVVAEGVENTEQYEALCKLCEKYTLPDIQGFYFSKPLPSEDFENKLCQK